MVVVVVVVVVFRLTLEKLDEARYRRLFRRDQFTVSLPKYSIVEARSGYLRILHCMLLLSNAMVGQHGHHKDISVGGKFDCFFFVVKKERMNGRGQTRDRSLTPL
jgi:hypothetical protein